LDDSFTLADKAGTTMTPSLKASQFRTMCYTHTRGTNLNDIKLRQKTVTQNAVTKN